MQQLYDYKVSFKGQKRYILALLEAMAQGANTRNGDSWQYKAILSGLGGKSRFGLANNFAELPDTDVTSFISAVTFIQEESQASKQRDFFRKLFGLVLELEGCAEAKSGGSTEIEVFFSPRGSYDVQISHREYGEKPWYENIPDTFKYQDVKLHGLDSIECSERLECINFGEVLEKKRVLVRENEWRIGLFTSKGQVGYLPREVSSVVMGVLELELGMYAVMVTVGSVTPVSKRRKGSKYGLLGVNITFSKPVRDLAKQEKAVIYDPDNAVLKNYIDSLPDLDGVVPEGLACTDMDEPEEDLEFTFSVTMHNAETGEVIDLNTITENEENKEEIKAYVNGVPREGKRVEIFDNLSIQLPYGVVYSKTEEGGCNIQMLSQIPPNYCDGNFKVPEDALEAWSISFTSELIICDCEDAPVSEAMESFQKFVQDMADALAGKNNEDTLPERSSRDSITESDGEFTYTHTMSLAMEKGDTSELYVENNIVICRAVMKVQIGTTGSVSYNYVLVGTLDYPKATIYRGQLEVDGDVDRVFTKKIIPILKTAESFSSTSKTPKELAEITRKRQEEEKRQQNQEEERKRKEESKKEARAKMQEESRTQEQKEEEDKKRVEKEKGQLEKQRSNINVKLEAANKEKEQQMAEIAALDRQIAQAQTSLKFTPFWKGAKKQEISGQLESLNAKKSYLLNEITRINANINSMNAEIAVISRKIPLILTKKEKTQREQAQQEKLRRGKIAGTFHGISAETAAKAKAIASVLTDIPMTATEINAALGTDYTALQVGNAARFIEGVNTTKVIRNIVNYKGQMEEKEYTAYFL